LVAKVCRMLGVPGPLLEHLAGGLDEVPLGRDAAESDPLLLPGEDVVDEVAELVEERDDVVVLHQPRSRSCRRERPRAAARPVDPGDEVELRGVLELALAGVQVEVDPPERLVPVGAIDVVCRDRLVPDDGVGGRLVAQAEEAPVTSSRPARTLVKSK
jgi:hypothetical protein